ncbi:DUF5696 domain-containing protein [Paenibacillus koleovorans]|uniref:DUF5696 domain-containing protein n=1 Tax=Paenibacillus koleovorans TaxID=121608 RepID=UPI000FDA4BF6|nr:DUF5696 domain-containing protein [Paenibacillus koleovorans]
MRGYIRRYYKIGLTLLVLLGITAYVATNLQIETIHRQAQKLATNSPGAEKVNPGPAELPDESTFQTVSENDRFRLKLDAKTAHFLVEDKKDGRIWRSYPDPAQWANEKVGSLWRTHLRSPIMLQFADLTTGKIQPRETNLLEERGTIRNLQMVAGGFRLTFDIPSKEFSIPVEVKLEKDSVVTRILDSDLQEGNLSLMWIRLYPFFGAERSEGQQGYMFIPDGSGALIQYDPGSINGNRVYQEPVYGHDFSFQLTSLPIPGINPTPQATNNLRHKIFAPVFGAKNENRAFLAVLEEGAEYAEIVASPAGAFSSYNWVTSQWNYRLKFRQVTNRERNLSFETYDKNERFRSDRTARYFLLDRSASDYSGMAQRFRSYLMDVYKLTKVKPKSSHLPMDIIVVGGDSAKGLLWDRYIKATSTSEAMRLLQRLYGLGIDNMTVRYWGWQKGGFGETGGLTKVDSRLGGDKGMKDFIAFAHSLDIPVYMRLDYTRNTTGAGGFFSRIHGLRSKGGNPIEKFASLPFINRIVNEDIPYLQSLGMDGVELHGIGEYLSSDYNSRSGTSRDESTRLQQSIIEKLRETQGKVIGYRPSFFAAPLVDGVASLEDDYSKDLFTATGVPFLQIALHGLIPYTAKPSNERDEYQKQFLHDLEFGSNPSYLFTGSDSSNLKYMQHLSFFNPSYKDWEQAAVQEYLKFSEALGDVQDQFIVNHRILSSEVRETTYENGKRIVVNYGVTSYSYNGMSVPPKNYLVVRGGGKP